MLNHGFSGHSNHSCDMDVMCPDGIHFGFLQTWAQLNNWAYWRQPWHLEPAGKQMFQDYARLRYQLLPYLYSSAAQAYRSGMPVMRAMSMVCPDEPAWDLVRTQYMLGDFLLVTAYTEELHLPAGNWFDFWRGNIMTGPLVTKAEYPANRGGCLLVREGAMIPTWEVMSHAQKGYAEKVVFLVYPGATISKFELYEDDGQSLSYRGGDFCLTCLECRPNAAVINASQGKFAAQIGPRQASMVIHLPDKPTQMRLNDKEITDWTWQKEEKTATVTIANWNNDEQIIVTWE
jgi:alpha-glucosidase (family GH31 glycosyl hydrolase)